MRGRGGGNGDRLHQVDRALAYTERTSGTLQDLLSVADVLLKVGEAVPIFGPACKVARDILAEAEKATAEKAAAQKAVTVQKAAAQPSAAAIENFCRKVGIRDEQSVRQKTVLDWSANGLNADDRKVIAYLRLRGGGCGSSKVYTEHTNESAKGTKAQLAKAHQQRLERLQACARYPDSTAFPMVDSKLILLHEGQLLDGIVISTNGSLATVRSGSISFDISLQRHQRTTDDFVDSAEHYFDLRSNFLKRIRTKHAEMEDAITGKRLSTTEQLIQITISNREAAGAGGLQYADYMDATNIRDIAELTLSTAPASLLLVADPGTGKSWSANQLVFQMADWCLSRETPLPILPFLLTVQELAKLHETRKDAKLQTNARSNVVLAFLTSLQKVGTEKLQAQLPSASMLDEEDYLILMAAYELRLLVIVVDGIDEAPMIRQEVQETLHLLVSIGICVIATSRPEGVDVTKWSKDFVIATLKPLSDEQQNELVQKQLKNDILYKQLTATLAIRRKHDEIYASEFTSDERQELETMEMINLFVKKDGALDPNMRQRSSDGSRFIAARHGGPDSQCLRELNSDFSPRVLAMLDEMRTDPSGECTRDRVEARLKNQDIIHSDRHSIATRLVLLASKKKLPTTELWPQIMARTDDLYVATEQLLPMFHAAMHALRQTFGEEAHLIDLTLAETLKDPIRIHEKAEDDYRTKFEDWDDEVVIPEACVLDVLRGRAVCKTASTLVRLQQLLMQGVTLVVEGQDVQIECLRNKHKFRDLDPMHFRNILNNLRMSVGERSVFIELQLHHHKVYQHNNDSHAHAHYEYFRSMLPATYEADLDSMLESTFSFLDEVNRVPVLLSMLVLIFDQRDCKHLPADRYQLYRLGMDAAISRAPAAKDSWETLRLVATASHIARKRTFDIATVENALGSQESWRSLEGLPLLKTLEVDTLFQFKHISFQEALFAMAIAERHVADTEWNPMANLEEPFFENVFRIGGCSMGTALAEQLRKGGHKQLSFGAQGYRSFLLTLPNGLSGELPIERLVLQGHQLDHAAVQKLSPFIEKSQSLKEVQHDVPVPFTVDVASQLVAAAKGQHQLCLIGDIPCNQYEALGRADAVLIAATVCNFLPVRSERRQYVQAAISGAQIARTPGSTWVKVGDDRLSDLIDLSLFPQLPRASHLKLAGYDAGQLRAVGVSVAECKRIGFPLAHLRAAGCTATECKAYFSAIELKEAGYSLNELKAGGISVMDAGFSASDCKAAGFALQDLKAERFSASELKELKFKAKDLARVGFTAQALLDAGFKVPMLLGPCGFSPLELQRAGVSADVMLTKGGVHTPAALKEAGYSAEQVRQAGGFSIVEMCAGGFSPQDFKAAGYSVQEVKAAGYSLREYFGQDGQAVSACLGKARCAEEEIMDRVSLVWSNTSLSDQDCVGLAILIASGALANLTKLYLNENQIGDEGIKVFSSALASGALANMTGLRLGGNWIGDAGIKIFSETVASAPPHWKTALQ